MGVSGGPASTAALWRAERGTQPPERHRPVTLPGAHQPHQGKAYFIARGSQVATSGTAIKRAMSTHMLAMKGRHP